MEKGQDFAKGDVNIELTNKLDKIKPVATYRGSHRCEFCDSRDASTNSDYAIVGNGKKYLFPGLLKHYIQVHKYLPPQEFLDALEKLEIEDIPTKRVSKFRRPSW